MKTVKYSVKASFLAVLLPIAFASQSFAENRAAFKEKEPTTGPRTGSSTHDQKADVREKEQRYKNKSAQENTLKQDLTVEQQKLILIN